MNVHNTHLEKKRFLESLVLQGRISRPLAPPLCIERLQISYHNNSSSPLPQFLSCLESLIMVTPCDIPVGVITGDNVIKLLKHAKDNNYAIPAFNCTRCVYSGKGLM